MRRFAHSVFWWTPLGIFKQKQKIQATYRNQSFNSITKQDGENQLKTQKLMIKYGRSTDTQYYLY
jgi:hypothetical protein